MAALLTAPSQTAAGEWNLKLDVDQNGTEIRGSTMALLASVNQGCQIKVGVFRSTDPEPPIESIWTLSRVRVLKNSLGQNVVSGVHSSHIGHLRIRSDTPPIPPYGKSNITFNAYNKSPQVMIFTTEGRQIGIDGLSVRYSSSGLDKFSYGSRLGWFSDC